MENYKWNQEYNEIEIIFDIKEDLNTKLMKYTLNNNIFTLFYNDKVIITSKFNQLIIKDTFYWYTGDNKIVFVGEKKIPGWWDSLFIGGEKIDREKLANEKTVDVGLLGEEERKVLSEMLYNQSKKQEN
ncbi:nuclear movement protein [Tubulinosema ratisbonensis]|uniref:Nuclear movement protein n=1 Tax=Tubulinosema ratisbonensis TaxID=291195 RepID=A0A437AJF7_9MICR|nr:nuclear movement protein [Tubulinosema ratisbonensis]